MHDVDVAACPLWSGLLDRGTIVRPIREFDGLVFAIAHEITPISATPRHLRMRAYGRRTRGQSYSDHAAV